MSLAFCLSFSVISHLPRSLSSSGVKPSFLGIATAGIAKSSEIKAPETTDTAATVTRLESVMGRPPSRGAWLETLQQGHEIGHLPGLYCRPWHRLPCHGGCHHRVVPQCRDHRRGGIQTLGPGQVAGRLAPLAV